MRIPEKIIWMLDRLNRAGYAAYIVGGPVRDSLMGLVPKDWDICTSALPKDVCRVFSDVTVIPTGIKHGTVTVINKSTSALAEVTTMRKEGGYEDFRRPGYVEFIDDITTDLKRRDFTVNAMAYDIKTGIVDPFGGQRDIKNKIIRCVGWGDTRFYEDALRILRGLRFASICGFDIEDETTKSMERCKKLLNNIASERIFAEIKKLVTGKDAAKVILKYQSVLTEVIPDTFNPIWFRQSNIKALEFIDKESLSTDMDLYARLAMLFMMPKDIAKKNLNRLKSDNKTKKTVLNTVGMFCDDLHEPPASKTKAMHIVHTYGADVSKIAANIGAAKERQEGVAEKNGRWQAALKYVNEVIDNKECVCVSNLNIKGGELAEIGYKGKETGKILDKLLNMVMDEKINNTKSELLRYAKEMYINKSL